MAMRITMIKTSEKYGYITSIAHWLLAIITVEVNHKCCCGYLHVMFGFKICLCVLPSDSVLQHFPRRNFILGACPIITRNSCASYLCFQFPCIFQFFFVLIHLPSYPLYSVLPSIFACCWINKQNQMPNKAHGDLGSSAASL